MHIDIGAWHENDNVHFFVIYRTVSKALIPPPTQKVTTTCPPRLFALLLK